MFFPIRTDRRLRRVPWVNYSLIAANILVFLFTTDAGDRDDIHTLFLYPQFPRLFQFITYQFIHGDAWHLISNMVFLFVFGSQVEDRLGRVGYLSFYLAAGVAAGLGHVIFETAPVIGASGAVCGVTGAFLVLFPRTHITIIYWFIVVGTFEVSSLLLIGFQIAQNVLLHFLSSEGVAHLAHLAGYAFGFLVGLALLLSRLVPREPFDLLAMWEHRRRRKRFKAMTQQGYQPWEGRAFDQASGTVPSPGEAPPPASDPAIVELRESIHRAVTDQDLPAAAAQYETLLAHDARQVLPRGQQLDVANQLMSMGRHRVAARAYELFLETYRQDADRREVTLMLSLLYVRYLNWGQRSRELLTPLARSPEDTDHTRLARQLLQELDSKSPDGEDEAV